MALMGEPPDRGYGSDDMCGPITMTKAEAEELYRFTLHSYIDPNTYPSLRKLIDRMWRFGKVHA